MESIIKNAIQQTLHEDEFIDVKDAKILVVGVGGAGNNMISRMKTKGINGAETLAINTDKQHLQFSKADRKILIGQDITKGLGAGGHPEIGAKSAEESRSDLKTLFADADMVFLTTGLGGGTGTGATPVLADIAKSQDCIVIGAVTMPFQIEGARISKAEDGLYNLRRFADTVIVIENDKLLKIAGELPLNQAFGVADELITTMIKGITETISIPSLVNLDYADVKAVMHSGGVAVVGYGESNTSNKGKEAIIEALDNPLLDVEYDGATGALIHISGGENLTLKEINDVGQHVINKLDPSAQVIWGARVDPALENKIQVIAIITGVKSPYILGKLEDEPAQVVGIEKLGLEMIKR